MNLRLLSTDNCAYVQRSAIVLEEKRVPYERVIVDFDNKYKFESATTTDT